MTGAMLTKCEVVRLHFLGDGGAHTMRRRRRYGERHGRVFPSQTTRGPWERRVCPIGTAGRSFG